MTWDLPGRQADPARWNLDVKKGWVPPGQTADKSRLQYTLPHGVSPDRAPNWHLLVSPPGTPAPAHAVNYTKGAGAGISPIGAQAPVGQTNFSMLPAQTAPSPYGLSPISGGVGAGQDDGSEDPNAPIQIGDLTPAPAQPDTGAVEGPPSPSPTGNADPNARTATTTRTTTDPTGGVTSSTSTTTTISPEKPHQLKFGPNGEAFITDDNGQWVRAQSLDDPRSANKTDALKPHNNPDGTVTWYDSTGPRATTGSPKSAAAKATNPNVQKFVSVGDDGQPHNFIATTGPDGKPVTYDMGPAAPTGAAQTPYQVVNDPKTGAQTLVNRETGETKQISTPVPQTTYLSPGQSALSIDPQTGDVTPSYTAPPAPNYQQIGNQIYDMNTGQPVRQTNTQQTIHDVSGPGGSTDVLGIDPYSGKTNTLFHEGGQPQESGHSLIIPGDWSGNVQTYDPKTQSFGWQYHAASQPSAPQQPAAPQQSTPQSRPLLDPGMAGTADDPGLGPTPPGAFPITPAVQGWKSPIQYDIQQFNASAPTKAPFEQSGLSEGRGRGSPINPQDDPMQEADTGEGQAGPPGMPPGMPPGGPQGPGGAGGAPWTPPPEAGGGGLDPNKVVDLLTQLVKGVNKTYPMTRSKPKTPASPTPPGGSPPPGGAPAPAGAPPMPPMGGGMPGGPGGAPPMPPAGGSPMPGGPSMGGPATGMGQAGPPQGMKWTPPISPHQVVGTGHKFGDPVSIEGVHKGVDLQAYRGTPARSPVDGVVSNVQHNPGGLGITVTIRDAQGHEHTLGHLGSVSVKVGQKVRAGEPVAAVGSTGASTGPHLDVREKAPNGAPVDVTPKLGMLAQLPRADNGMEPGEEMPQPDIPQVTPGAGQDDPIIGMPNVPPDPLLSRDDWSRSEMSPRRYMSDPENLQNLQVLKENAGDVQQGLVPPFSLQQAGFFPRRQDTGVPLGFTGSRPPSMVSPQGSAYGLATPGQAQLRADNPSSSNWYTNPPGTGTGQDGPQDADTSDLLQRTNYDRQSAGESALQWSPPLGNFAQGRSQQIVGQPHDSSAHYRPNGSLYLSDLFGQLPNQGQQTQLGENLAWVPNGASTGDLETAWMGSPTHRQNILNPAFTSVGMGRTPEPGFTDWAETFEGSQGAPPPMQAQTPGSGQDNIINMQRTAGGVWRAPFGAGQDVGVGASYTVALEGGGEMTVNASSPQAAQDNVRQQGGTPTNDISTRGAGTTQQGQAAGGGSGQPNSTQAGSPSGASVGTSAYDQATLANLNAQLQERQQNDQAQISAQRDAENNRHQEALMQAQTAQAQEQENARHNQAMEQLQGQEDNLNAATQIAVANLQSGTQIGIANAQIAAQFGIQSQQFKQQIATSALQNPWLQRLTGMLPGFGQVGGPGGQAWVPPTGGQSLFGSIASAATNPNIPQATAPQAATPQLGGGSIPPGGNQAGGQMPFAEGTFVKDPNSTAIGQIKNGRFTPFTSWQEFVAAGGPVDPRNPNLADFSKVQVASPQQWQQLTSPPPAASGATGGMSAQARGGGSQFNGPAGTLQGTLNQGSPAGTGPGGTAQWQPITPTSGGLPNSQWGGPATSPTGTSGQSVSFGPGGANNPLPGSPNATGGGAPSGADVSFQDFSNWSPFQQAAWRTSLEAQGPGAFQNEQDSLLSQWGQQGITGPTDTSQLSWDAGGPMGQMQKTNQAEFFGQDPSSWMGGQQKNWAGAKQAQVSMT